MEDEVKQKLLTYLSGLEDAFKEGGEFVAGQLPLFVSELLAWEFYSSIYLGVVFMCLSCVFAYFVPKCYRLIVSDGSPEEVVPYVFGTVISVAAAIALAAFSLTNYYNAVKVSVAPRVVLMEKIVELGNSVRK